MKENPTLRTRRGSGIRLSRHVIALIHPRAAFCLVFLAVFTPALNHSIQGEEPDVFRSDATARALDEAVGNREKTLSPMMCRHILETISKCEIPDGRLEHLLSAVFWSMHRSGSDERLSFAQKMPDSICQSIYDKTQAGTESRAAIAFIQSLLLIDGERGRRLEKKRWQKMQIADDETRKLFLDGLSLTATWINNPVRSENLKLWFDSSKSPEMKKAIVMAVSSAVMTRNCSVPAALSIYRSFTESESANIEIARLIVRQIQSWVIEAQIMNSFLEAIQEPEAEVRKRAKHRADMHPNGNRKDLQRQTPSIRRRKFCR